MAHSFARDTTARFMSDPFVTTPGKAFAVSLPEAARTGLRERSEWRGRLKSAPLAALLGSLRRLSDIALHDGRVGW